MDQNQIHEKLRDIELYKYLTNSEDETSPAGVYNAWYLETYGR